jgi:hypothetical protein
MLVWCPIDPVPARERRPAEKLQRRESTDGAYDILRHQRLGIGHRIGHRREGGCTPQGSACVRRMRGKTAVDQGVLKKPAEGV